MSESEVFQPFPLSDNFNALGWLEIDSGREGTRVGKINYMKDTCIKKADCAYQKICGKKSATNVNHRDSPLHALLILLAMVIDNVHWILMNDFSIPTHWFLYCISHRTRQMRFVFQRPICLVVCFNKSFLDG